MSLRISIVDWHKAFVTVVAAADEPIVTGIKGIYLHTAKTFAGQIINYVTDIILAFAGIILANPKIYLSVCVVGRISVDDINSVIFRNPGIQALPIPITKLRRVKGTAYGNKCHLQKENEKNNAFRDNPSLNFIKLS